MFLPYLHRIQVPQSLTFSEVEQFVNAEISRFIVTVPGFSQKHTPSLRNMGEGVYELVFISEAKYELSPAIKAKVDTATKEVQNKVVTLPTVDANPTSLGLAPRHPGGAGIPHAPSKIKG